MFETSVLSYVQKKGWEYKEEGTQYSVKLCPFCGNDKGHFYINKESGLWDCKKCQAKGNLYQLKKQLGDISDVKTFNQVLTGKKEYKLPQEGLVDKYHEALLKNEKALTYLRERGFLEETIKQFKLGYREIIGTDWISIPHIKNGKVVSIKFRSLPPAEKTFRRTPDTESILFNQDCLKDYNEVILVEGEFDAITSIQTGFKNVVATTLGAGSFLPEWYDLLSDKEKIYFVYDIDEIGQRGAFNIAKRLGLNKCYNILLPLELPNKDINDYFIKTKHTPDDFKKLLTEAKLFPVPNVFSFRETLDELEKKMLFGEESGKIITPWSNVDKLIKGFSPGNLVVVSAPPKTGKTTFCNLIAFHNAKQGTPAMIYCLEMREYKIIRKLLMAQYNVEEIKQEIIQKAREDFISLPLYFVYNYKKLNFEVVTETIREAKARFDLQVIVFDNLHFLCRDISNTAQEVGFITRSFKLLAEELGITVILIAQPRKIKPDEIMSMQDLRDSSSIPADADIVIIMHRNRKASTGKQIEKEDWIGVGDSLDPITLIRLEASRYTPGGETLLYFHGATSNFTRVEMREVT